MTALFFRALGSIGLSSLLIGCASVQLPPMDRTDFLAAAPAKRVLQRPTVIVNSVEDVHVICQGKLGRLNNVGLSYLACATWNQHRGTCVINIQDGTHPAILGHELRHCFEGHFH